MAEATCARIRALSVRDDVRHGGVVLWKPVRRPEAVGDLLPREAERAAGHMLDRRVGRRRGSRWCTGRPGHRDRIRPRGRFTGCSKHSGYNERRHAKSDEGKESAHTDLRWSRRFFPAAELYAVSA